MPEAAIALGSNMTSRWGDREKNLREALRRMGALGEVVAVSSFHETAPVGYLDQPDFVNAAALLRTHFEPEELMSALLQIERAMGRVREGVPARGPRVIDLDLLLLGDAVVATERLLLPHPAMAERLFVLAPLAEIAGDWVHPRNGKSVAEMLRDLSGPEVRRQRVFSKV